VISWFFKFAFRFDNLYRYIGAYLEDAAPSVRRVAVVMMLAMGAHAAPHVVGLYTS
jgi:hypothetical protein